MIRRRPRYPSSLGATRTGVSTGVVRTGVVLATTAVVLTLGASAVAAQDETPPGPESLPVPSEDQLAQAVRAWDPTAGDVRTWVVDAGSVRRWVVSEDAVRELEETVVEGTTTTIMLSADVLFAFASDAVSEEGAAKIAELVAAVPQGATVAVDGHTDSRGGDAVNLDLSNRRATAVAAAVTAARPDLVVVATGHGSSLRVATEGGDDDDAARALNRRVEISYTG